MSCFGSGLTCCVPVRYPFVVHLNEGNERLPKDLTHRLSVILDAICLNSVPADDKKSLISGRFPNVCPETILEKDRIEVF